MHFGITKKTLLVAMLFAIVQIGEATEIKQILTTDSFQPYSIKDVNGNHSGVILEIIKELQERVSSDAPIKFNSWGRTQGLAKTSPATAIFPLVRSRKREFQYKWIGHIFTDEFSLVYLKKNKKLNNILSNKTLDIGTANGSFINQLLRSNGFESLYPVATAYQNIRKLFSGRIQYWATPRTIADYNFQKAGISKDKVGFSHTIIKMKLYLAVSKDVSDKTAALWRQALYEMKQDGSIGAITKKFIKTSSI
jgi:polar amino acid transport system substrate-binding protein